MTITGVVINGVGIFIFGLLGSIIKKESRIELKIHL